jgi:hypothetical protein
MRESVFQLVGAIVLGGAGLLLIGVGEGVGVLMGCLLLFGAMVALAKAMIAGKSEDALDRRHAALTEQPTRKTAQDLEDLRKRLS